LRYYKKLKKLNMKKVLLSAALIVAVAFGANAQKGEDDAKLKFSAGLEAALPLGDFGKSSSFGIGASAQANYNVAENIDVTLNAGYISFAGKDQTFDLFPGLIPPTTVKGVSVGYIPVLAGISYNFTESLYGSAQLGLTFASVGGTSSSVFTYAPGIGYKITENIDALLKYTGYNQTGASASTIGLRVAYTF
jgi:Outer membrane protein beta-barrel domain